MPGPVDSSHAEVFPGHVGDGNTGQLFGSRENYADFTAMSLLLRLAGERDMLLM